MTKMPQAIIDAFNRGKETVLVSDLAELKLVKMAHQQLGAGHPLTNTGQSITLTPSTPIHVRQNRIRLTGINKYLQSTNDGTEFPKIAVYYENGLFWHIDGLHRIVTSRILGESVLGEIWN